MDAVIPLFLTPIVNSNINKKAHRGTDELSGKKSYYVTKSQCNIKTKNQGRNPGSFYCQKV